MNATMYSVESSPILIQRARQYLMGRLSTTLLAGQSYCVTFYAVMSQDAAYAIDHIGAYLDDGSIDTNSHCGWVHTQYTPQVYGTSIIADTLHWIKIQGSFIANGTEKYITIGNFFDTAHTNKILNLIGVPESQYEIDDVSVIATGTHAYAGPDVRMVAGAGAYIGVPDSNGDGMPCYWYVLGPGGTGTPIDSSGRIFVNPTDTTTYVVAMDLCGVVTYDTVTVNVLHCPGAIVAAFTDTGSHTKGYTYTGTTYAMDSIRWNFGDGGTSTLLNPVHTFATGGLHQVCVTVYTGCGSDSSCKEYLGVASIGAAGRGSVQVWPNPVRGQMTVAGAGGCELYIYDVVGREVYKKVISSEKESVPIGFLERGVYIVQIVDGMTGERVVKKIIKE